MSIAKYLPGLFFCVILIGCGTLSPIEPEAGQKFAGVSDLKAQPANPFQVSDQRAVVLIFVRTDCPVSNRYAPEIERLYRAYSCQGVAFWLVYPDADTSLSEIAAHRREYGLDIPALHDPKHSLARRAAVKITPEVAVFISGQGEVYRGRIDDRMADWGKERPEPQQHDLEDALKALVASAHVSFRTTRAIGCYIGD